METGEKNALVMYVKRPHAGKVKTRLTGVGGISKESAASLYESLLYDLVNLFKEGSKRSARGKRELDLGLGSNYAFYICSREHSFALELSKELGVLALEDRGGGDIGLVMLRSLEDMFLLGYKKVVILGSDLPYIRPSDAIKTFELLENNDYVLGGNGRGGFYILGTKRAEEKLFNNIGWSVGRDYVILSKRIESLGYKLHKYKASEDINLPEDIKRLYRDVIVGADESNDEGRGESKRVAKGEGIRGFKEEMPKTVDMLSKLFHVKHKGEGI